ncbi:hypothetical protein ABZ154_15545 [Streptomyces sp. NPDC006261]|uniref:hypothetical protein n=1 Tax=Streptomyces sp. NPDC006261 TaxID=3156739 RepID=UPI0033BF3F03
MWTCETCGTENQQEDEHCQNCDTWRSDQEDDEPSPVTRVQHSGPDTRFCILCLSGEHQRIDANNDEE